MKFTQRVASRVSRVSYHTLGLYILGDTLLGLGHAYAGVSSEPFLHATRPFVTVFFIYSVSVHFFASRYAVVVYRVASASAAVLASRYSLSLSLSSSSSSSSSSSLFALN